MPTNMKTNAMTKTMGLLPLLSMFNYSRLRQHNSVEGLSFSILFQLCARETRNKTTLRNQALNTNSNGLVTEVFY